jgi:hypothetical protein
MKRHKSCLAVLLFATMIAVGSASANCSNAHLNGTYGFLVAGTAYYNNWLVPGDAMGQVTFDGNGNLLAGSVTQTFGGTIVAIPLFSGTYSVAKDCTGTVTIAQNGQINTIALDNGKSGFQLLYASGIQGQNTEGEYVGVDYPGYAVAQGNATCGLPGNKHHFALNLTGTINNIGPVAVVGQLVLDGNGNIKGSGTSIPNGTVWFGSISGSYTENANCTGTMQITPPGMGALNFNTVKVDREILVIETDSGSVVSGNLQQ